MEKYEKISSERDILTNHLTKLKKRNEEITNKNNEKSAALKSIRSFFLTSSIFKVKNLSDLEKDFESAKK